MPKKFKNRNEIKTGGAKYEINREIRPVFNLMIIRKIAFQNYKPKFKKPICLIYTYHFYHFWNYRGPHFM